jgi:eukaryotic-like serine/threonine-protein kinase
MSFRFVILNALPPGGNGDLFIGQRTDNGEYVVAKFLREHHLPHARRAFEREVRILASKPMGLVPVLGWNIDTERPYYVMPYFTGGSLTRYAGNLTDTQLHVVATELALKLASLHAGWCAHGDVKPDNILVDQEGQLRLADPLGNGLGCTGLFSQNNTGGTPGYCAPEVRAGGPISNAGDAYSYGATLYELLTGRRPQDGQRLHPTLEGYRNVPRIREVIEACCQFDSNARPTMQEVLRVLRGERWAGIQAARKQRQQLVAVCVIGIVVLLGAYLTRDG